MVKIVIPHAETFAELGKKFGNLPPEALAEFFDAFTLAFTKHNNGFAGDDLRMKMRLVECATLFENRAQQTRPDYCRERQME